MAFFRVLSFLRKSGYTLGHSIARAWKGRK